MEELPMEMKSKSSTKKHKPDRLTIVLNEFVGVSLLKHQLRLHENGKGIVKMTDIVINIITEYYEKDEKGNDD